MVSGFLRYYFLTVEDNVESSLTRRFAVLAMLLCLFGTLALLLRRGRLPEPPPLRCGGSSDRPRSGCCCSPSPRPSGPCSSARSPGWPVPWGAVTAFAVARVGLHSRRNLALYVTALLFVLAWATSGTNGWFYVGNYGVPWFDRQPVIASHPVTSMFLVLAIITGLFAAWLHFRMDYAGHTQVRNTRRNRVLASTPLLAVAIIMVVLEVGSMGKRLRSATPSTRRPKPMWTR